MRMQLGIIVLFLMLFLPLQGCQIDELTGEDPTPTPVETPVPPTATPTVAPTATPTPDPGARFFQGSCFNPALPDDTGAIWFTVFSDGRVSGHVRMTFLCVSTEDPYPYLSEFTKDFETYLQGSSFTWSWTSPSPAYVQTITLSGSVSEASASGVWTYSFFLESQQTVAECDGAGTWSAS